LFCKVGEQMKNSEIVKQLISRIAKDDTEAFTKFFDLYFTKVLQFSGYFIKSEEICQEVTSDVFLNIWNSRSKLPDIMSLESFLYTVTKNKAFDYLDKISRQPDFTSDLPLEIHSAGSNPEAQLLNKELEGLLNASINELPERCKLIFLMAREEGLKYQEIAKILAISEKTVNAQMVTAIKKIGNAIRNYLLILL
jgi:RNA polymerase sigma-70 factor (family 1)